jgi:hypothetical protein
VASVRGFEVRLAANDPQAESGGLDLPAISTAARMLILGTSRSEEIFYPANLASPQVPMSRHFRVF